MWCGKKGIDCPDCGVFGECYRSACGLPVVKPSELGTSSSYSIYAMTEMEEIKTMLANMNKKLDKVIFQNKIALNTKYGLPIKQEKKRKTMTEQERIDEMEELLYKKFREVEQEVVKEFVEKLKNVIHERDYLQGYAKIGLIEEIDELLKEYE